MFRLTAILGGAGLLALAAPGTAEAQYGYGYGHQPVRNVQCERQNADDRAAGAIVGAVVGGLIGGAIGNNIDNDRYYTKYNRRGRPVGHYRQSRSNSGQVAVGATLGALAGGLAGREIASGSSPNCQVATPYHYTSVPHGSIPQTTHGLYGGPEVMRTPAPYPQSGYPAPSYPARAPAYPNTAPDWPQPAPAYPSSGYGTGQGRECRTVYRETRLPDGRVQSDPVTACRAGPGSDWRIDDGFGDDELYGY